jgi:hypothetical protein
MISPRQYAVLPSFGLLSRHTIVSREIVLLWQLPHGLTLQFPVISPLMSQTKGKMINAPFVNPEMKKSAVNGKNSILRRFIWRAQTSAA